MLASINPTRLLVVYEPKKDAMLLLNKFSYKHFISSDFASKDLI